MRSGNYPAKSSSIKSESIFRKKDKEEGVSQSPADKAKAKYEESLPNRYYENENRLSWEFEESPPVEARTSNTRISDSASILNGKSFSDPKNEQRFEVTNKTSNDTHLGPPCADRMNRLRSCGQPTQSKREPAQAKQKLAPSLPLKQQLCGRVPPKPLHARWWSMEGRLSALAAIRAEIPHYLAPLASQSSTRGEYHSHAMSLQPSEAMRTRHKPDTAAPAHPQSPNAQSDEPPLGSPQFWLAPPSPCGPARESTRC